MEKMNDTRIPIGWLELPLSLEMSSSGINHIAPGQLFHDLTLLPDLTLKILQTLLSFLRMKSGQQALFLLFEPGETGHGLSVLPLRPDTIGQVGSSPSDWSLHRVQGGHLALESAIAACTVQDFNFSQGKIVVVGSTSRQLCGTHT